MGSAARRLFHSLRSTSRHCRPSSISSPPSLIHQVTSSSESLLHPSFHLNSFTCFSSLSQSPLSQPPSASVHPFLISTASAFHNNYYPFHASENKELAKKLSSFPSLMVSPEIARGNSYLFAQSEGSLIENKPFFPHVVQKDYFPFTPSGNKFFEMNPIMPFSEVPSSFTPSPQIESLLTLNEADTWTDVEEIEDLLCDVIIGSPMYCDDSSKYFPKRPRYAKEHKGRMKGNSYRDDYIGFGKYALLALEPARITSRQIFAGLKAIKKNASGAKIWVRIFAHKPITSKPAETRMGRGKGSLDHYVAVVKPGQVIYEMDRVTEVVAKKALVVAASKFSVPTQFVVLGG
ncbi:hypothetical protein RJ639_041883 [Escallonia herrerae]|uniref:Ribosomal protein L16 n=1 Tax=Escallonia herrerae TaxID=1293975 RepID=A0AA88WFD0_9ASTE|nr:hypothetical protein RJ639_041883 [Escallonia herrerae]